MVREVYTFPCTITAGTPQASPLRIPMVFPTRVVVEVDIMFPPGPSGLVGVALGAAGAQVVPSGNGQWVVADDETIYWPLEDQIQSGSWSLIGYNLGTFDHTIQVRFLVNLPPVPQDAPLSPIAASALSGTL